MAHSSDGLRLKRIYLIVYLLNNLEENSSAQHLKASKVACRQGIWLWGIWTPSIGIVYLAANLSFSCNIRPPGLPN
jgi:hypothetical protein